MKKSVIIRTISLILFTFFVYFAIGILFAYFRGDNVNVPEELTDATVFSAIYFAITYFLQRKKKANNTDDNTDNVE